MTKRRLIYGVLIGTALCFHWMNISGENSAASNQRDLAEEAYAEIVDDENHAALLEWARSTCSGIGVEELAELEGVEATISAVADAVAGSLSPDIRETAIEVCQEALGEFRVMQLRMANVLADYGSTEDPTLVSRYASAASEILRYAMAPVSLARLINAVERAIVPLGGGYVAAANLTGIAEAAIEIVQSDQQSS